MTTDVPSSSARVITCLGRRCIGLRVLTKAAVLTLLEQDNMTGDTCRCKLQLLFYRALD